MMNFDYSYANFPLSDPDNVFAKIHDNGALHEEIGLIVKEKLAQLEENGNQLTLEQRLSQLKFLHVILNLRDQESRLQSVGFIKSCISRLFGSKNQVQKEIIQFNKFSGSTFRHTLHQLSHAPDIKAFKQVVKGFRTFKTLFSSDSWLIDNFIRDSLKQMGFSKWYKKKMPSWATKEVMDNLEKVGMQMKKLGIEDDNETLKIIAELKSHSMYISSQAALPADMLEKIGAYSIEFAFICWENNEHCFDPSMQWILSQTTAKEAPAIYKEMESLIRSHDPQARRRGEKLIYYFFLETTSAKQKSFFQEFTDKNLLLKVLSHLPVETSLLDLSVCCAIVDDETIQIITTHLTSLQSLNLARCFQISDVGIQMIATRLSALKYLTLSGGFCSDAGIHAIATHLSALEYLNLAWSYRISDIGVQAIANHLISLQYLNLSGDFLINDVAVRAIATRLTALKHLNLSRCPFSDEGAQAIATHLLSLVELNLSECPNLTDVAVCAIATRLTALRHLNLSHCSISNMGFQAIATHLLSLVELNLSACPNLTDEGVQAIASRLTALRFLNLSQCSFSDVGVQAIATHLTSLLELNLSLCQNLTDEGVRAIANHLTLLEFLNLSYCSFSDNAAQTIATRLLSLQHLDLTGSFGITDVGVQAIATHLTSLLNLILAGCSQITDASVQTIATHLTSLQYLSLTLCFRLTDASVQAIATHLTSLKHINLIECQNLSDAALSMLYRKGFTSSLKRQQFVLHKP
jgi:hypothetical protein